MCLSLALSSLLAARVSAQRLRPPDDPPRLGLRPLHPDRAPRPPTSAPSTSASPCPGPFALYQLANVVEAIGFFLPGIYLPSYAADALKAGPFPSALTALLVNVSSVAGCVVLRIPIDRLHVTTCTLACTVCATVGTFLLWGFAVNLPVLYILCILYGISAGSFTTTWTGIMGEVSSRYNASTAASEDSAGHSRSIDPSMVFVLLAAGRQRRLGPAERGACQRAGPGWERLAPDMAAGTGLSSSSPVSWPFLGAGLSWAELLVGCDVNVSVVTRMGLFQIVNSLLRKWLLGQTHKD